MWCSVAVKMGVVCTPLRSTELDSVTHSSQHMVGKYGFC